MKIERKKFLKILENVKPGVDTKTTENNMSYFFFSGTHIISYNNKISIAYPIKTKFTLYVKAYDLYKVICKLSSDYIIINENNNKLNIRCKDVSIKLPSIQDAEMNDRIFTVQKSIKNSKWSLLPNNFSKVISDCAPFTSKNEFDSSLTFVYINGKYCMPTDNMRIIYAIFNSPLSEMFIKSTEVSNIIDIDPIKCAITKSWIHFKNKKECVFSIRNISAKFPDIFSFFNFDGEKLFFPSTIVNNIDIASLIADTNYPIINITIENNTCLMRAHSDSGSIFYKTKIKYNNKQIKFSVNPNFLKDMLISNSPLIISKDKAKIETDNFSLLTMLIGK
jgi:hypothetical protein